ncbi:hypothetical protein [Bradyrhizobium uaiense]|uniref:Uncharacterized protein n=1 Tax=Bradyrhizobium uaiense TaxID=2594946 RepID=A0A6P1BCZ3_9BRAD|nr:hypothetical protein [Bradyrhizobium uaiense]NEU96149.1 hypothetical protein [Bradyrhizobium uaiense]
MAQTNLQIARRFIDPEQRHSAAMRSTLNDRAFGVSAMAIETAKAIMMIFLFGSLLIAIHMWERIATKRLRALALRRARSPG